ncbi:class I SAM-dependent methyltransferase [Streptomyces sp. NPDC005438]|uniref:class I SAM-dependent methyltransferase n=1 Tax=Streptomyces sp. NPDC005438 TaxID=3156880 RepID=UPI0033BC3A4D
MTTISEGVDRRQPAEPRNFEEIPGWLYGTDVLLFDWLLRRQRREGVIGDLLELGAYQGKSAVLMAAYLRSEEHFTVVDLFGTDPEDESNLQENRGSYATLTRQSFEANYLAFHPTLPRVIQAPTSVVPQRVEPGSCRFVHVDASHLYEHVRGDIEAARQALRPDGLVVLDDYRSEHTPGVACATWGAVLEGGLRPICVSGHKFYGTWGDPEPLRAALRQDLEERVGCRLSTQRVAGQPLLLVNGRKATPPPLPRSRYEESRPRGGELGPKPSGATRTPGRGRRPAWRRWAVDLTPPVVARALVRVRDRRSGR